MQAFCFLCELICYFFLEPAVENKWMKFALSTMTFVSLHFFGNDLRTQFWDRIIDCLWYHHYRRAHHRVVQSRISDAATMLHSEQCYSKWVEGIRKPRVVYFSKVSEHFCESDKFQPPPTRLVVPPTPSVLPEPIRQRLTGQPNLEDNRAKLLTTIRIWSTELI